MTDIVLASMPFVALERPSLALGLLQASARQVGLTARGVFPSFRLAERIGVGLYSRLLHTAPDHNIGDWIFAGAAFPEEPARHAAFLDHLDERKVADWLWLEPEELRAALWRLREHAEALVARTASSIVTSGARIVGCSSVFQQQCASLALLRAVKQLDPSIQTMLGGANCEGEMGRAVHGSFGWVDYVVSGEADLIFGELCRSILSSAPAPPASVPAGVLGPARRRALPLVDVGAQSRARVHDVDRVPVPEYADYFSALSETPLRDGIFPALLIETSRGCWWGEKHHCTFCGLNGDEMTYRPKSVARVLEEFEVLAKSYGMHRFLVVDNILHHGHLKTLIPALIDAGAPYSIFYETKANLTRAEVERLADAGVRRVQPGFESMHIEALELFDKGTTPVTNLQYLKSARTAGTFVAWNFLCQIPGEEWSWYAGIADWVPLVTHLQPPNTVCAVRFDRFSPYHQHPEAHGLELRPTRGLEHIYPVDAKTRAELAYYFTDFGRPVERSLRRHDAGIQRFEAEMDRWMNLWDRVRRAQSRAPEVPKLEIRETSDGLEIVDTRPIAPEPVALVSGLDADVLAICDDAPSRALLARRIRRRDSAPPLESMLAESIERLKRRLLLLELDGRLVGLPTPAPKRPYLAFEDHPCGHLASEHEPGHRLDLGPSGKVVASRCEDAVGVECGRQASQ